MTMKPEQVRVKDLITDTVLLLCKNGLSYSQELRIEGVIGVTLDNKDLFLVHVNERLSHDGEPISSGRGRTGTEPTETPNQTFNQNPCQNSSTSVSQQNITDKSNFFNNQQIDGGPKDDHPPTSTVIKIEDKDTTDDSTPSLPSEPSSIFPPAPPTARRGTPKRPYQQFMPRAALPGPRPAHPPTEESSTYEPEAKRFAQDPSSSRLELAGTGLESPAWLDEYTSQAMAAAAIAMEMPCDGRVQAPPAGYSPWGSTGTRAALSETPTASSTAVSSNEPKYPSHALQSQNIKEAVAFGIVDPLLAAHPDAKIMTFRLSWFGSDSAQLDKVWQNIVSLQEQMDQFVTGVAGAKVVVSAYTGTLSGRTSKSDTSGLRMSYPGLGYWLCADRRELDERTFMRQLHEHAFGARIKSLLYEHEQNKDKITNALFVVLKDCTGGFVRRKVDESLNMGADRSRMADPPALVRLWVKDTAFWDTMVTAQGRLKNACCDVSVHQV